MKLAHIGLAGITIVASWTFTQVMFALQNAPAHGLALDGLQPTLLESDVRTAIAQVAGMGAAMVYDGVWFGSRSPAESPSIPGSTGLTPPAPLPYEGRGE